jgi:hypothetical protein
MGVIYTIDNEGEQAQFGEVAENMLKKRLLSFRKQPF